MKLMYGFIILHLRLPPPRRADPDVKRNKAVVIQYAGGAVGVAQNISIICNNKSVPRTALMTALYLLYHPDSKDHTSMMFCTVLCRVSPNFFSPMPWTILFRTLVGRARGSSSRVPGSRSRSIYMGSPYRVSWNTQVYNTTHEHEQRINADTRL